MRFPTRSLLLLFLVVFLGTGVSLLSGEEKSVEFEGKVSAVDLAAKTISVRHGNKDFVFKIDIRRCNVVKDGYYPFMPGAQTPALRSARVGDSVVGELVVEGSMPVVTQLYLTTKPEPGVPAKGKPGYVTSPYHLISPLSHNSVGFGAIDVRGYQSRSMLVDGASGKIFLVP